MPRDLDLLGCELSTVLVVADTGSFTRTARRLGLDRSIVCHRVRAVEDYLGIPIFEREGPGVALTPAGKTVVEQIARCWRGVEVALHDVRREVGAGAGPLKISG